ncbi:MULTISPECIES: Na+/H+ antiporter [Acetobacter]|jgi:CPA1 family monovalent cation:H+ antiporter|uniref:CPA1 family monovalent cation:H+ antiporter n=1 Tax=Acetobacter lovaniensis TaxID=104100 RepID=A0A841QE50_9PROT|nr:Na+/H+ antiporter [Acetobacter lovaniensis]MBB6456387.1 CPA1 family monovalent cation:H+ antiporter [Acetobacter lovaniensis]MCI1698678.1 Na+/H+ antiporter [Acetobacter lovaniensis]MCI1795756.1 Na+/H+ antiporter [Acetobacter lovaniensis]MCP1240445.1 Na+/H+ antiporter [Acetobacter lovaniensis]NHN80753.1 Na+/H+ antiporter [Acetobacter lovaniensis]
MLTIEFILLLLLLTAVSSLITLRFRQKVPQPVILIALGVCAGLAGMHVQLHPELFMFVFLPPLLFADAFRMPLREFGELRGPILFLAFGLVVLSTLLCGYAIHWILPVMSLPVCFTLSAALSPTDTVAVSSLIKGRRVPTRLLQLLSGEALFNDASGLVCFRFAMADALTGEFSYQQAFGTFLLVAFGGLAIGGIVAWVAARLNKMLTRSGYDETQSQIVLVLLLPFLMYALAEAMGCSGILAAVAGCMVVKLSGIVEDASTSTRLQSATVWTMVSYVFNALIFLFLGLQLPSLLQSAHTLVLAQHVGMWRLGLLVVQIYCIMLVMRFMGVWLSIACRWASARINHVPFEATGLAASLLLSFAGVRGAVTLAAVLSLPTGEDGTMSFPTREAVVVIATGVIILSLLVASVIIPLCLKFIPAELVDKSAQEENMARQRLLRAALDLLRKAETMPAIETLPETEEDRAAIEAARMEVIARLTKLYQTRLEQEDATPRIARADRRNAIRHARMELALRLQILRAERQTMRELVAQQDINDQTEWKLQQELDYEEEVIHALAQRLPKEV